MSQLALRSFVACSLFVGMLRMAGAASEEFVFGIFPYLSPSQTVDEIYPAQ